MNKKKNNQKKKKYDIKTKKPVKNVVVYKKNSKVMISRDHYELFILIFLVMLLFSLFSCIHFLSYDHDKVRTITKTKKVVTVSPNYVFLGDSITWMYDLKKYFPNEPVVNSGISGDTTDDVLANLEERVYQYNPSKLFLLIGTNDIIEDKTKDEIVDNIKKIIQEIKKNRPACKIYLESLLPVNRTKARKISLTMVQNRTNEDIMAINEELKNMASELDVTYIDLYPKLLDEDGNLELDYTKEGLHIVDAGYEVITDELEEYLEE